MSKLEIQKKIDFVKDLIAFFEKYKGLCISWGYSDSSDMHGVNSQSINFTLNDEEFIYIDGQNCSLYELKRELAYWIEQL